MRSPDSGATVKQAVGLQAVPVEALLGEIGEAAPHEWKRDSRWQMRCDSVREIALRGVRIREWSEAIRICAASGTANEADLEALATISEALPQLRALLDEQVAALKWSVAQGRMRE